LLLLIMCSQTLFEAALVPEIPLILHDRFLGDHILVSSPEEGGVSSLERPNL